MTTSEAAFANFPSEVRGILSTDTYTPISLHTADVHVLFSGYAAQVTLSLEYVNETNRLLKAIAAYPVPPGFQLQYTTLTGPNRAITNNVYQQSRSLKTTEATSSLPPRSVHDIMTSAVATQAVPWDISPGDSLLMTSVYHAPLALIQRQSEVAFTLPTSLFPAVTRPPEAQRNYVTSVSDKSSNRRVGRAGGLYLHVEGQLYSPLRGPVTLDKAGYIVEAGGDEKLAINYRGDSGFDLTYQGMLSSKEYTQQALTVHAPIGEVTEPLRLHTTTVPPTETAAGMAAVAATVAPSFPNCPVNAELVFLIDLHTADLAQEVAEVVAAVMDPKKSTLPSSVQVNVMICNDNHRNGCVALFPMGSKPINDIPYASVLAYMKEEMSTGTAKTKKATLAPTAVYSPQLPAVLHDVLAGQNVATAVPDGYVRNVILLTDAGGLARASESAAMVNDAVRYSTNTRVHCVALATTADRAVLETLALASGGRFRAPATAPPSAATGSVPAAPKTVSKILKGELMAAVQQTVVAAAVPCLCSIRTVWKVVRRSRSKSGSTPSKAAGETVKLAANDDGKQLPCIPRGTRRTVYGLIYPAPPAEAAAGAGGEGGEDGAVSPPESQSRQLNVRLIGRVGPLSFEYTAAALIASIANTVAAAAATTEPPSSPAAPDGSGAEAAAVGADTVTPPPQDNASSTADPPQSPQLATSDRASAPGSAAGVAFPGRDDASAASAAAGGSGGSPTKSGRTLLLHTAAAAARIAYLSNGHYSLTTADAVEMIELSRRCLLPSPYTTLTDGRAPLSVEQKRGGVVYMPSVLAKSQLAVAIRTRRAEVMAVMPQPPVASNGKDKDAKSADKKKASKTSKKDVVSLYSSH